VIRLPDVLLDDSIHVHDETETIINFFTRKSIKSPHPGDEVLAMW
jgi:hypothetical protein